MRLPRAPARPHLLLLSLVLALGMALRGAGPALAKEQAASRPAPPSAAIDPDFAQGLSLLRSGRRFNDAIDALRGATLAEPNAASTRTALGCAYASRAAAIAQAARSLDRFYEDQRRYARDYETWKAAQKAASPPVQPDQAAVSDPPSPPTPPAGVPVPNGVSADAWAKAFAAAQKLQTELEKAHRSRLGPGSPPPRPPVLRTKDDDRPFDDTREQALAEIEQLSYSARDAWASALTLAANDQERTDGEWARAWGELVLLRSADALNGRPAIPRSEVLAHFRDLASRFPESAAFQQGLGDALLAADYPKISGETKAEALAAYRRALRLQPKNGGLWFRLYDLERPAAQDAPEDTERADALRKAAQCDPGNAFPLYHLAAALLPDTGHADDAQAWSGTLSALRDARETTACRPMDYRNAVPAELAPAWRMSEPTNRVSDEMPWALNRLAAAVCGYVAAGHAGREAGDVLRDVLGIGERLEKSLPGDSATWTLRERILDTVAFGVVVKAYPALIQWERSQGDADADRRVTVEYGRLRDGFLQRARSRIEDDSFGYGDY